MKHQKSAVLLTVLLCCAAMAVVEGVLRPGYAAKSAIKVALFGGSVALYALKSRDPAVREMFSRTSMKQALLLSLGVYGFLLGSYWILRSLIDLGTISRGLMEKENITAGNFLFVALYISVCNSFLEELFFRGFAYLTLRRHWQEMPARIFSAAAFAVYHVFILQGWFSVWIFVLALTGLFVAGLLFNYLDRKGSLFPSWLVHASANLAINTVGLMMFGFF